MGSKRRRFTAAFKYQVALEALQGNSTIRAIAARYQLNPRQVSTWKRQAMESIESQAPEAVNSQLYWDKRFVEDWETFQGPHQSRAFTRLAIEHMPPWLIPAIRRQKLVLADWGCAQGDGSDEWASYIGPKQVVGIDFSSVAIDQAAARYPAIRFINEDWLSADGTTLESFDLLFSSNTLEHFHDPYEVLGDISRRGEKGLVLVLPYRERDRIDEHFYSFFPDNIPLFVAEKFRLVWSKVIDCTDLDDVYWSGEQIVLVLADPDWYDELALSLKDCYIHDSDHVAQIRKLDLDLVERDNRIAHLGSEVATRDEQIAHLRDGVATRDEHIAHLGSEVATRDEQIAHLRDGVATRDEHIAHLGSEIATRDEQIAHLGSEVATRDEQIVHLRDGVATRDEHIAHLGSEVATRDEQIVHLHDGVATRDEHIAHLRDGVATRDEHIAHLGSEIATRDEQIAHLGSEVATRDAQIVHLGSEVATRDAQIAHLGSEVATRGAQIVHLGSEVATRDEQIVHLGSEVATRDAQIAHLGSEVATRGAQIVHLGSEVATRDEQIVHLGSEVATRDAQIAHLGSEVATRGAQIVHLGSEVATRDEQIVHLRDGVAARDEHVAYLRSEVAARDERIAEIHASTSWRLTRPIRGIKRFLVRASRVFLPATQRRRGILYRTRQFVVHARTYGLKSACRRSREVVASRYRRTPPPASTGAVASESTATLPAPPAPEIGQLHGKERCPRVAMLVQDFHDGGVEKVAIDVARQFVVQGIDCPIMVAGSAGRAARLAEDAGCKVRVFDGDHARLVSEAGNDGIEVLFVHHCYEPLERLSSRGVKLVEVLHNAYSWQRELPHLANLRSQCVCGFIAVSDFVRDYAISALSVSEDRIRVIENGLSRHGLIRPPLGKLSERRKSTVDRPCLLHLANAHPQKNHVAILRAFEELLGEYADASLVLAGSIDDSSDLGRRVHAEIERRGLGNHVRCPGPLGRREVSRLLAEAHVGLLPSGFEGFSIASLEYAYFGLPTILSDTGAARRLASRYEHAVIADATGVRPEQLDPTRIQHQGFDPDASTVAGIAAAMHTVLTNYNQLADRARHAGEDWKAYSIDSVADRYRDLVLETAA